MNTGNKILGKHIRQFDVLVVQNSFVVVQNNGKGRPKSVLHVQICFLLIKEKNCAARAIWFFFAN